METCWTSNHLMRVPQYRNVPCQGANCKTYRFRDHFISILCFLFASGLQTQMLVTYGCCITPWKHRRGCFCGMILHNFRCARGRTSTSFDALNWFTPRTQLPPPHPLVLFSCTLASRTILAYPGISCSPFFRAVMHLYLIKHFLRVSVESIISLARLEFHYGPTRDWVENTLGFHPIVIKFPRP